MCNKSACPGSCSQGEHLNSVTRLKHDGLGELLVSICQDARFTDRSEKDRETLAEDIQIGSGVLSIAVQANQGFSWSVISEALGRYGVLCGSLQF